MSELKSAFGLTSCFLTVLLAACGGGTSTSVNSDVVTSVNGLALSGTAATGLALSGAPVNAKCRTGSGTTTSASDGSYSLTVASGVLPCVLQVSSPADGKKMHAIAINAGIINLTPLTDMLSTRLMHGDMSAVFTNPDAAAIEKAVTASTIKQAQTDVSLALLGYVDLSKLGDFYSTPLKAATAANASAGDAQDKLLDSLKAKMSAAQQSQMLDLLAKATAVGLPLDNPDLSFKPTLELMPMTASVATNGKLSFAAATNYPPNVRYIRQPVKWSVQESNGGSITLNGEYTAPDKPGIYHVTVQREDFPALSATATITVGSASSPVFTPYLNVEAKSVSLKAGSQYFFSAGINYPPGIYYIRQPTTWSLVEANAGTIDILGAYTAPVQPGVYHVRVQRDDFPELTVIVEVIVI